MAADGKNECKVGARLRCATDEIIDMISIRHGVLAGIVSSPRQKWELKCLLIRELAFAHASAALSALNATQLRALNSDKWDGLALQLKRARQQATHQFAAAVAGRPEFAEHAHSKHLVEELANHRYRLIFDALVASACE